MELGMVGDLIGGAASVATGGLFGGLLRLVPEVFKMFQAKGDRDHEYRMAQLAGQQAADGSAQRIREMEAQSVAQIDMKSMDAWTEAIKAQAVVTGNKLLDGLNIAVRPIVTYYFLLLYGLAKLNSTVPAWSSDDYTILGGILSFWFVGRTLDKQQRGGRV